MILCPKLGEEPLTLSRTFFLSVHWYRASFSDHVCSLIGRVNISRLLKRNEYWLALPTHLHKLSRLSLSASKVFHIKRELPSSACSSHSMNFFICSMKTDHPRWEWDSLYHFRIASSLKMSTEKHVWKCNHMLTAFKILMGYAYSCTRAG